MGHPIKGVVLPLEPFAVKVRKEAHLRSLQVLDTWIVNSLEHKFLLEQYSYQLIKRLIENRFLVQVVSGIYSPHLVESGYKFDIVRALDIMVTAAISDYELFFSSCLDSVIRTHDFPEVVYLDKLGDAVIVTWK